MKYAIVCSLLILAVPVLAQDAPSAQALADLEKRWESLKSFRAVYSGSVPAAQADGRVLTVSSTGKLEMLKHEGVMKYRLDQQVSVLGPDGTAQSTSRMITLYNGKRTYVTTDVAGSKSVMILSPEGEAGRIPLDARALIASLQQVGAVTRADDEQVAGIDTYVFEGAPVVGPTAEISGAAKMRVNIAKATGVPVQWVLLNAEGKVVAAGHYTDVEINPSIDPELFRFEVPVGATVVDMSAPKGTPANP